MLKTLCLTIMLSFTQFAMYMCPWNKTAAAETSVTECAIMRLTLCCDVIAGVSTSVPPDSSMAQFQEVMRQQLECSMHAELEKLLGTAKGADAEVSGSGLIIPIFIKKKESVGSDCLTSSCPSSPGVLEIDIKSRENIFLEISWF